MRELRQTFGTAIILITHDMGVAAENADRVVVMYAGRKVKETPADDLFERPAHPCTCGLLASIPNLDTASRVELARSRLRDRSWCVARTSPCWGRPTCCRTAGGCR